MQNFDDFKGAVTEGRKSGVPMVKNALFRLATGYDYDEKEINQVRGEDGEMRQTVKIIKKKRHPDLNACIIYLRNYDPGYRDKDAWEMKIKEMEVELRKTAMEMEGF